MKNKKIRNYILIVLLVLIITIVGVSFAYFTSNVTNDGDGTDVNTQISNRANLEFTKGDNLSISANMDNFRENGNNLSSSSTSTATLKIDANESYTAKYYVYFNILENEFVHTAEDAELLLKIEGPDGEINTIEGLSYVTSKGEKGFDITEEKGLFKVSVPEEITTIDVTNTEDWEFTLFFINLDSNQNANAGKTFESEIILSKEEVVLTTFAEEIIALAGNGQVVHETFIDATSSLANAEGIVDTGYRYEGANPDNYVTFNNETWRIIGAFDTEVANTDETHTTEKLVKIIRKDTIGNYSWDNSNTGDGIDYNNNWPTSDLFHLLNESYLNAENGTNGVAKNSYCWSFSSAGTCDFTNSGIQDNSRDMIEKVKWNLGGESIDTSTSSDFYKSEKGTNVYNEDRATEVDAHIGLIYISDYGFSALEDTCSRDQAVYYYDDIGECHDENWLFRGYNYWSIVPSSSSSSSSWYVDTTGYANTSSYSLNAYGVAPVLYLKSDVEIDRGVGTESDPYILK